MTDASAARPGVDDSGGDAGLLVLQFCGSVVGDATPATPLSLPSVVVDSPALARRCCSSRRRGLGATSGRGRDDDGDVTAGTCEVCICVVVVVGLVVTATTLADDDSDATDGAWEVFVGLDVASVADTAKTSPRL